ncbi:hypothetical protein [Micromonospora sp. NPDC047134]|uniref:hypothetical protein n=1 Tax=Micromonospora sp. NPDC047134 TaxID=3154340 RepID=UPI0033D6B00B
MGDGDADAGDFGGPDFAPVTPAVESSAFGAPPTRPAALVLGPGFRGHVVLPASRPRPAAPPADDAPGGESGGAQDHA